MSQKIGGNPNLGLVTGVSEFLMATMAQQNTNLGVNDHLKWSQVWDFRGGQYINLDTLSTYSNVQGAASIGRFTLKRGPTYLLQTCLSWVQLGAATDQQTFIWFNATDNQNIGNFSQIMPYTITSHLCMSPVLTAVVTPTKDILVEVRHSESVSGSVLQVGIDTRSEPWALIRTI